MHLGDHQNFCIYISGFLQHILVPYKMFFITLESWQHQYYVKIMQGFKRKRKEKIVQGYDLDTVDFHKLLLCWCCGVNQGSFLLLNHSSHISPKMVQMYKLLLLKLHFPPDVQERLKCFHPKYGSVVSFL